MALKIACNTQKHQNMRSRQIEEADHLFMPGVVCTCVALMESVRLDSQAGTRRQYYESELRSYIYAKFSLHDLKRRNHVSIFCVILLTCPCSFKVSCLFLLKKILILKFKCKTH